MGRKRKVVNPDIEYENGINLFKVNSIPPLPKYMSTLLNNINGWAGGSNPNNVGQVSEIIKDFRKEHPQGNLDDWKEFHCQYAQKEGLKGIEQGVKDIEAKIKEVMSIDFLDDSSFVLTEKENKSSNNFIQKWLENLVYEKSFCGLISQELILKKIASDNGMTWMLGGIDDEKKGIDGYIIDSKDSTNLKFFPLQIKSSSYGNKHKKEHFICPIVTYEIKEEGICFKIPENALKEPENQEGWESIKENARGEYEELLKNQK